MREPSAAQAKSGEPLWDRAMAAIARSQTLDTSTGAEARGRLERTHNAIAQAQHVLVLGAGPVGLELAGEITTVWPDLGVSIVEAADSVLGGTYPDELRRGITGQLAERGVEIVLGDRLEEFPGTEPGVAEPVTVHTVGGQRIQADVWFRCYGTAPVTNYLAESLGKPRRDGRLVVDEHLRLPAAQGVLAAGDIVDADLDLARAAQAQASVVATNVLRLAAGRSDLASYRTVEAGIFVPLGPDGGAGLVPGSNAIADAETVANIKGADMFLADHERLLGRRAD